MDDIDTLALVEVKYGLGTVRHKPHFHHWWNLCLCYQLGQRALGTVFCDENPDSVLVNVAELALHNVAMSQEEGQPHLVIMLVWSLDLHNLGSKCLVGIPLTFINVTLSSLPNHLHHPDVIYFLALFQLHFNNYQLWMATLLYGWATIRLYGLQKALTRPSSIIE